MAILITGGTGYIGSHTVVELLNKKEDIIIIDNFSNSNISTLEALKNLTKKDLKFYKDNYLNENILEKIFTENTIDTVIHFAGFKSVAESTKKPLDYYKNNVLGTISLLDTMKKFNVKNFIFSSSSTVYGNPTKNPIDETFETGKTTSPYGSTKYFIEQILQDLYKSDNSWNIIILRYFNPIGAHESGMIGESPNGMPNNLMPYIVKVACGELKKLSIFGNDYNTQDGTGVRDYIHIVDLAKGHLAALNKLEKEKKGFNIYNLGTGRGYSVLEIVNAFEKTTGKKIPYEIAARRPGDIDITYSNPEKAQKELNWKAEKTIEDMCRDSWKYIKAQKNHPNN